MDPPKKRKSGRRIGHSIPISFMANSFDPMPQLATSSSPSQYCCAAMAQPDHEICAMYWLPFSSFPLFLFSLPTFSLPTFSYAFALSVPRDASQLKAFEPRHYLAPSPPSPPTYQFISLGHQHAEKRPRALFLTPQLQQLHHTAPLQLHTSRCHQSN